MLRKDKEEVEAIKHAKALEAEKAMYSVSLNMRRKVFVCFCVYGFSDVCVLDRLRAAALVDRGGSLGRRG